MHITTYSFCIYSNLLFKNVIPLLFLVEESTQKLGAVTIEQTLGPPAFWCHSLLILSQWPHFCHSFVAPCHSKSGCWPSHEPPTGWCITLSVLPHPVCESASLGLDEIMFKGRFGRKRLLGSCGAEGASANDTLPSFKSVTHWALCISSFWDLHANRCRFIMGSRLGTLALRTYHCVCDGQSWKERPRVANCLYFFFQKVVGVGGAI